jgi:hypothetical protein
LLGNRKKIAKFLMRTFILAALPSTMVLSVNNELVLYNCEHDDDIMPHPTGIQYRGIPFIRNRPDPGEIGGGA